eukprot:scaffold24924_cov83-Phaeocystis_antarctica.AAC.2
MPCTSLVCAWCIKCTCRCVHPQVRPAGTDPGLQSRLAKSELANSDRTTATLSVLSGSAPGASRVCAPRTAHQASNSLTARYWSAGSTRGR